MPSSGAAKPSQDGEVTIAPLEYEHIVDLFGDLISVTETLPAELI